jgi:hypothetical protein
MPNSARDSRLNSEEELSQVKALLSKLGASDVASDVMARQLVKRADQWVEERGIGRVEAMRQLLELVVAGRSGGLPPGFEGASEDNSEQSDDF